MLPVTKQDAATRHALDYEVEAALAWHDEDPRATIATLLADIRHLRLQLFLSKPLTSRGMAPGWSPKYQRD